MMRVERLVEGEVSASPYDCNERCSVSLVAPARMISAVRWCGHDACDLQSRMGD